MPGGGPETYGLGAVALAVIAILSLFVRSLVKRQDKMFEWFTERMNGSLEALKEALSVHSEATIHNTKNLKQVGELFTTAFRMQTEQVTTNIERQHELLASKLDELLERDRSQTRENDRA